MSRVALAGVGEREPQGRLSIPLATCPHFDLRTVLSMQFWQSAPAGSSRRFGARLPRPQLAPVPSAKSGRSSRV